MTKKTKIVLGISAASLVVLVLAAVDLFFFEDLRQLFWMEIHDESRLASFLANIEDNSVVEFPEKIESLKAAERDYSPRGGSYHFVLRFKTDKKGLAQLRESLSQLHEPLESDAQPDRNSEYYADPRVGYKEKGIPEWYSEEMPEGVHYEFYGTTDHYLESRKGKLQFISCACVTLADSEEVIVYMEGFGFYSMKDYGD
jgi:hypothetical protein